MSSVPLDTLPPSLLQFENDIFTLIRSKERSGAWFGEITIGTKIPNNIVKRCLNSLLTKGLIKQEVQYYWAVEFEPYEDVPWSLDWKDVGLVWDIQLLCLWYIDKVKIADVDGTMERLHKNLGPPHLLPREQVEELLTSLVLKDLVVKVESTGLGDYRSIPIGTTCYKLTDDKEAIKEFERPRK